MTAPGTFPLASGAELLVDSAAVSGLAAELRALAGEAQQQSRDAGAEGPAVARALTGEVGRRAAEAVALWAEVCVALADRLLALAADVDAALLTYRAVDDGLSTQLTGPR